MKIKNIIALSLVVIILAAIGYGYFLYKKIFQENANLPDKEVYVYIPTDATYPEVLEIIKPYVHDVDRFDLVADKSDYKTNVRSGRFLLKSGMSSYDIVKSLRVNVPVKLSFNNQERLEDLAGRIAQQLEPDSLSLLNAFKDPKFLEENGFTPETALAMYVPNTYEFYWNISINQFMEKMAKEHRRFWNEDRLAKAEAIGLTPNQVVTLASIVHKETVKADERPKVAGAYMNRLNMGMPLQADPTAVYAYKLVTNDFNQVIKRVKGPQISVDSPYNTYKYEGLPPGPIFMPDISAVDAVLNYEKHEYLFFCASVDRFGYHEFAKTYEEHSKNSAKYHKWLNSQGY